MEEKKVNIRRFYRKHPLILVKNVRKKWREEVEEECYGCGKSVANSEMAYVCMKPHDITCFDIILHEECGELPRYILHPRHPHHYMELVDFGTLGLHRRYDVCRCKVDDLLGHRCGQCDFNVDASCERIGLAPILEGGRKELQHPSHPGHPLTLMRKPPFSFYCDGCGVSGMDMAYVCNPCEFWLHKSCATSVALTSECRSCRHHHRLSLAYSFPEKHRRYDYKCEGCDKLFDRTCWVYYCGDCRYFVHVKRVGLTKKPNYYGSSDTDRLAGFPLHASDVFHKLIKPFVMKQKDANRSSRRGGNSSPLLLENYHEHPLSLVSDDDEDRDGEETKICGVCITPIPSSTPYYKCTSYPCAYSIHSICSFLPHTIHAHDMRDGFLDQYGYCSGTHLSRNRQQHIFKLFAPFELEGRPNFFQCHACRCYINGMGYECRKCKIQIDVKCASLPIFLKHTSHPHAGLVIRFQTPYERERL